MIVAFSTSSAHASVALIEAEGAVLAAASMPAQRRASGACMEMLEELLKATGRKLDQASLFAADLGPGSFTGARVGVTLAKTFAYLRETLTLGASAFDLIDPVRTVALPSRKGEFFIRTPGEPVARSAEVPDGAVGYGFGGDETYPLAARFVVLERALPRLTPHQLTPFYISDPSISQPKRPYGEGVV
ncbi:MAG TPA: tRNA (adenosine(37)-N6)-threonylcarbamoyltransferase complex dimerization subunit type 1 TsaB [Fimbriimonas sp.]